jgi:hypothetical protein
MSQKPTFKKNLICEDCGCIRSDRSEFYCSACNKKRSRVNKAYYQDFTATTEFLRDDSGTLTRLHGDILNLYEDVSE